MKTNDQPARFNGPAELRFVRILPGPIERVWDFLADVSRLPAWFGDARFDPRPGGAVTLMGGHIRGLVTACHPPRRLTYTWNVFSPGESESAYPESYVSFELQPHGEEVRLILTHLPVLERFEKQTAMGWHTFLDMFTQAVRGHPVEPRDVSMRRNAALYGVDLSNLAR